MLAALQVWKKNPYFSGRYSATTINCYRSCEIQNFNPCFSGRYSATRTYGNVRWQQLEVSILVLVEGTLQPDNMTATQEQKKVSILVLVEGTLQPGGGVITIVITKVSILVLVEGTLQQRMI